MSSDGQSRFAFAVVALVSLTDFSTAFTSLGENAPRLRNVYCPRIVPTLSAIVARLLDLAVGCVVPLLLPAAGKVPTADILMLPMRVGILVLATAGTGLFFSAICVQFRYVKHASEFGGNRLMYAAPVVYPAGLTPAERQRTRGLDPMAGVIEGSRAALLGTRNMPFDLIACRAETAAAMTLGGLAYFRVEERLFADVA